MHELSVAASILDAVQVEATQRPNCRITTVGVRVGELSGVEPDSLSFCFESLVHGSELDPLALEMERMPWRHRCPSCTAEFDVADYDVQCPSCGEAGTECVGGYELELTFLEIDEP